MTDHDTTALDCEHPAGTDWERPEAETMYATEAAAPPPVRDALGIATTRIGGGVVLAMAADVTRYWNKALGFGVDAPLDGRTLDEILGFYRDHGVTEAVLQVAPDALPPDWPDLARRHGLDATDAWAKFAGAVDVVVERTGERVAQRPGLPVETVGAADLDRWAAVTMRGFGMPEEHYAAMMAAFADAPEVTALAVVEGERLVGTGAVRIEGTVGHLYAHAVLPEARRRGGQTALLAASARVAADAGCRWLVAETAADRPDDPVTSHHNMLRAGLAVRYHRPNWRWRAPR